MSSDLTGADPNNRRRYHPDPTALASIKANQSNNAAARTSTVRKSNKSNFVKKEQESEVDSALNPTHVSLKSPKHSTEMSNIGKPARGWLHPDHLLAKEGINYSVRVSLLPMYGIHF